MRSKLWRDGEKSSIVRGTFGDGSGWGGGGGGGWVGMQWRWT